MESVSWQEIAALATVAATALAFLVRVLGRRRRAGHGACAGCAGKQSTGRQEHASYLLPPTSLKPIAPEPKSRNA